MTSLNTKESQTIFVRSGDMIFTRSINTREGSLYKLEPGFYSVEYNDISKEFYLRATELCSQPAKIYGDVRERSERVLNTFACRGKNTGVLLHGMKGTGKSLLSRQICIDAVAKGIPVINITQPYSGPAFNDFMEKISQAVVVNVDEFEKVYSSSDDSNPQEQLLSLMDGVTAQNKLWILTVNDTDRVNEHMLNRPGRLFYKFEYTVIPESVVEEVCKDKGMPNEYIDDLLSFYSVIRELTFDVLSAIIEESLRYKQRPREVVKYLNVDLLSSADRVTYDISIETGGKRLNIINNISINEPAVEIYPDDPMNRPFLDMIKFYHPVVDESTDFDNLSRWDVNEIECEIVQIHGRRGVLELKPKNLRKKGLGKFLNTPCPEIKIFATPRKIEHFDYWKAF